MKNFRIKLTDREKELINKWRNEPDNVFFDQIEYIMEQRFLYKFRKFIKTFND